MTHFLIVYDQVAGNVVLLEEFPDADRERAIEMRYELEREHSSDPNLEVIVLSAADRRALEITHARYFKGVQELAAG